jgi:hypothetical protein
VQAAPIHISYFSNICLQAPQKVKAVQVYNISLRMLHKDNQNAIARPFVSAFQSLLRSTTLGESFFNALATPQSVKAVLSQAYYDTSTVTDELVECILNPGKEPGAVQVFLDFIRCVFSAANLTTFPVVCSVHRLRSSSSVALVAQVLQ